MWPTFFARLSNPDFDSITQDIALEFREHGKHAGQGSPAGGGHVERLRQRYEADGGLKLVVAAITLSNTVYLDRAIKALRYDQTVEDQQLQHLSPLPWDQFHLTADSCPLKSDRKLRQVFTQRRRKRRYVRDYR